MYLKLNGTDDPPPAGVDHVPSPRRNVVFDAPVVVNVPATLEESVIKTLTGFVAVTDVVMVPVLLMFPCVCDNGVLASDRRLSPVTTAVPVT